MAQLKKFGSGCDLHAKWQLTVAADVSSPPHRVLLAVTWVSRAVSTSGQR